MMNDCEPRSQNNLGDRIRTIADQLKQETQLQIKATSRILGATAQISENYDRLIDEVTDMVQEDLNQEFTLKAVELITVDQLKHQFKSLAQAKAHFDLKATSWAALVDKLNEKKVVSSVNLDKPADSQGLASIEVEIKALRTDLNQVMQVLAVILDKVS